jgi:Rps23 Pro-64 3,4-dihydroxylase Tpa1-like proline 4-hydroxylase
MAGLMPLHFSEIRFCPHPFRHFTAENFADAGFSTRLLRWFEKKADWKARKIENFYRYSDINLRTSDLVPELSFLVQEDFLRQLQHQVGEAFGVAIKGYVDVTGHRLAAGDRIRVHSDFVTLRFTHRLLVQVNHGWAPGNGGVLGLLDRDPESAGPPKVKRIVPLHRSGFAFEVSKKSFHKVSRVIRGERYTLIFSFYPPQPAGKS